MRALENCPRLDDSNQHSQLRVNKAIYVILMSVSIIDFNGEINKIIPELSSKYTTYLL